MGLGFPARAPVKARVPTGGAESPPEPPQVGPPQAWLGSGPAPTPSPPTILPTPPAGTWAQSRKPCGRTQPFLSRLTGHPLGQTPLSPSSSAQIGRPCTRSLLCWERDVLASSFPVSRSTSLNSTRLHCGRLGRGLCPGGRGGGRAPGGGRRGRPWGGQRGGQRGGWASGNTQQRVRRPLAPASFLPPKAHPQPGLPEQHSPGVSTGKAVVPWGPQGSETVLNPRTFCSGEILEEPSARPRAALVKCPPSPHLLPTVPSLPQESPESPCNNPRAPRATDGKPVV